MMKIENVIEKLDNFWLNDATEEEDGRYFFSSETTNKEEYREVENLLWDCLISENHWNYNNKNILQDYGYHCWIGDGDIFGLLVACVTKDNKTFSFG